MKLTDKQIETLRWIRRAGIAWPCWRIHASTRRALGKRGLIEFVDHASSTGYRLTEKAEGLLDEQEVEDD